MKGMQIAPEDIGAYYDLKTDKILKEFGPGPVVHYHTGIRCPPPEDGGAGERFALFAKESQRNVLDLMIDKASGSLGPGSLVIDFGCGLGGACLYLARRLGVDAIGVSLSKANIEKCQEFARAMELEKYVEFVIADAQSFECSRKADAALAVESACYMDRKRLFANAKLLLRPGATFQVFDWEIARTSARAARIDAHWMTRMGSPDEYREAARESGFELVEELDFSEDGIRFFEAVRKWNESYYAASSATSYGEEKMKQSLRSLDDLIAGFAAGEVLSMYQLFRRGVGV
jgi:tocopherol O-methyltransferase